MPPTNLLGSPGADRSDPNLTFNCQGSPFAPNFQKSGWPIYVNSCQTRRWMISRSLLLNLCPVEVNLTGGVRLSLDNLNFLFSVGKSELTSSVGLLKKQNLPYSSAPTPGSGGLRIIRVVMLDSRLSHRIQIAAHQTVS